MTDLDQNTIQRLREIAQTLRGTLDETMSRSAGLILSTHPLARLFREQLDFLGQQLYEAGTRCVIEPSVEVQRNIADFIDSPVFAGGVHKSGTTLFRNLLDGHSNVLTLPTDGQGYHWLESLSSKNEAVSLQAICMRLINALIVPIPGVQPTWILGDDILTYLKFLQHYMYWRRRVEDQESGHLRALACAFYAVAGDLSSRRIRLWAEKSTDNIEETEPLIRLFPNAKFIHIVRHPASVIAAQKRKQPLKGRRFGLFREIALLQKGMRSGINNLQHLGKSVYHVLRYEELVSHPESVMTGTAGFIGVNFEPILLRPTVNLLSAGSNTAYGKERADDTGKISLASVSSWQKSLSSPEIQVIMGCFHPLLRLYGYDYEKPSLAQYLAALLQVRRAYQQTSEHRPISLVEGLRFWLRGQSHRSFGQPIFPEKSL